MHRCSLMLPGWLDCAASFEFLIDALPENHSPVLPADQIARSIGANAASVYTEVRPGLVSHFLHLRGTSHNLHHEARDRIADLIEQFLTAGHGEITA